MTARTILGVEYFEVPSTNCYSNIGRLKCGLFSDVPDDGTDDPLYVACLESECATGEHRHARICFLTAEQYGQWVAARITS